MVAVGDIVANYRITGVIGRGAMATVYRAHDERLNRDVALKLLDPAYSMDFIFRARFEREYRITALLKNDHIVPIYDGGTWGEQLYIAMMLVDGPNLAEVMKAEGPLQLARVISIVAQLADALDEAHAQRVIHRDVKPANVLMTTHGPTEHIYLADFGLTLGMEGTHLTRTGGFMGTLAYTAPEQLNSAPIDGRADEYALAATTYQMLTGEMPYRRDNEMALINAQLFDPAPKVTDLEPHLPPRLDAVIARGMAKKPEDRYPSAAAFAKALTTAAGAGASERVPPVAAAGARGTRRVAPIAVILGLIAAAVIGAAITFAVLSGGTPTLVPSAAPTPSLSSGAVAVASPTPLEFTPLPSPAPTATPLPSPTPRPTRQPPSGNPPSPTRTPRQTLPPTATPTLTPPPDLPLVAEGNWSVDNSPTAVSGDPYVVIGEHQRRYVIASRCASEADCRLAVNTFDAQSGKRLGSITFKWDGQTYTYRGAAQWYSREGGDTCQTSTGEQVADAYSTHEEVRVRPAQTSNGLIVDMTGTKTISGTPTAAGQAANCAPFEMTYSVDMNATQ